MSHTAKYSALAPSSFPSRRGAIAGLGRVAPSPHGGWVQGLRPCRAHWEPMLKCALAPFGASGFRDQKCWIGEIQP
jgi:hypothetical protein